MEKQTRKPDFSSRPTVSGPLAPELDGRGVARQPYRYQKEQKPRKPNRLVRLLLLVLLAIFLPVAILGVVGLLIANAILDGQYSGKIEPGVSISGVYVGEMTREQAKAVLQDKLVAYNQRPVLLAFQDKIWQPSLEQLGVSVNLDTTIQRAFDAGRRDGLFESTRLNKLMNPQAYNLPIELQIDENKLKGYLGDISDRIRKEAVEPTVSIKDAQVITTDGAEGFNVDFDVTYDAIRRNLTSLQPITQNLLTVHNVPPVISQQELADFKSQLTPLMAGPITLKFKDKTWKFDEKAIAKMITLTRSLDPKQPRHFTATVNTDPLQQFVADLRKEINQEPKEAKIAWQDSKLVVLEPSSYGQYLVVDKTTDQAIKLLNEPAAARNLDLIVDVRQPQIDSNKLDALGLKEVIGEGVSHFGGSAIERSTNIQVGAKYLNGALIKPHSTFSFLNQIGEISEKRGYMKGYAIVADQTVPDVGGGICQVATTTFRAAFYSGMPIVERHEHAYRVSWYEELGEPVGFDAAVYEPGVDFKFENSSDYWMAISAFVKNGNLYVQVWGTKPAGQTVELVKGQITNQKPAPPDRTEVDKTLAPGTKKQVDYAHPGLDTSITRVIKINGIEQKREVFNSHFQAWPNIFKVGPTPA